MLLKIVALGLYFNAQSYFRDSWNVLDFFVVLTAWISIVVEKHGAGWGRQRFNISRSKSSAAVAATALVAFLKPDRSDFESAGQVPLHCTACNTSDVLDLCGGDHYRVATVPRVAKPHLRCQQFIGHGSILPIFSGM